MIFVVGSGPAGVSCARALLEQDLEVTMLDVGFDLPPEKKRVIEALKSENGEFLEPHLLGQIRGTVAKDHSELPHRYGSDHASRGYGDFFSSTKSEVSLPGTLAKGGFSTLWGGAVLPLRESAFKDWPISLRNLEPFYKDVLKDMPLVAAPDPLQLMFPLYTDRSETLRQSRQVESLTKRLNSCASDLSRQGIHFGASRLAVHQDSEDAGCLYCGLCHRGCPKEIIYETASSVDSLQEHYQNFHYKDGILVTKLVENGDSVTLVALDLKDNLPYNFVGTHAYIGCGVRATTELTLEALNAFGVELNIQDSAQISLPILNLERHRGLREDSIHTLCQLFLEFISPQSVEEDVHCQLYGYNDLFTELLKSKLGKCEALVRQIEERLMVSFCYLHSERSPRIKAKLERDSSGVGRLKLWSGSRTLQYWQIVFNTVAKFVRNVRATGLVPLLPLLQLARPGQFFHSGGSIPMRKFPGKLEADPFGRPHGMKRIHLVDSSIFPTIPAGTMAFTIMANARRIGAAHFLVAEA